MLYEVLGDIWVVQRNPYLQDDLLHSPDFTLHRSELTRSSDSPEALQRAFEELRQLSRRITDFYRSTPLSRPLIQLMHGCHAAFIITEAARRNKNSVGCHYRVD